ncbi:MAG: DUF1127 domain-containing protein [Pseudomonadota bacterium]
MARGIALMAGAGTAMGGFIGRWSDRRTRLATLRRLERLHPAVLRDMGMSRGEIISVCLNERQERRRNHA